MPKVWHVVGAFLASFVIAVGLVGTVETFSNEAAQRESLAKKDDTIVRGAAERKRMFDELVRLRNRLDELADQNAALADLLREQGVDVPASLVTRTTTRTVESDSDDDSDDDDRTSSRMPTRRPTTRPPSSRPPAPDNDDDLTDVVPKVDLPEPVGKATDDVKKIADDALDGTIPLIP